MIRKDFSEKRKNIGLFELHHFDIYIMDYYDKKPLTGVSCLKQIRYAVNFSPIIYHFY